MVDSKRIGRHPFPKLGQHLGKVLAFFGRPLAEQRLQFSAGSGPADVLLGQSFPVFLEVGNNLFGESLVCVDLKTGQRKWHFQIVHHPVWDYDLSSAHILADINVDGKPVKAVALPTKQSFLYVFNRVTGQPLWPIDERPVPQSDVPGEKTSPTQPFPAKPPAYSRNFLKIPDDLIDFTPEMRNEAIERLKHYRVDGMFTPPVIADPNNWLGGISMGNASGGTN